MHIPPQEFKKLLVDAGVLSPEDFDKALKEAEKSKQDVADILIGRGLVDQNYLLDALAGYFNVEKVDLRKQKLMPEVLNLIPESFARTHNILIFNIVQDKPGKEHAEAAMVDPGDIETISYIEARLNKPVKVFIASRKSLDEALKQYQFGLYSDLSQEITEKLRELQAGGREAELAKLSTAVPVVSIIDKLLEHAASLNASDIHFEPFEEIFIIRYRIDGVLREILALPTAVSAIFAARVKVLANLKVDEHLTPQDGRFTYNLDREKIDVRVSVMPVFWGEKVVMRLLRSTNRPSNLQSLGLTRRDLTAAEESTKITKGLVLLTGPTGSGKTTTLYAMLQILNNPGVNISTIEDPVEYTITRINQTQVNVQAGLTFANGLRSFLRQDPNIIMVGEIRDKETTDLITQAALTGHLVLSTLHTNDAPTAIPRLIDMGAANFLLASILNIVIAQRLVRQVCSSCVSSKEATAVEKMAFDEQVKTLKVSPEKVKMPKYLFAGAGCSLCGGSGYRGRTGIFEVLPVSEGIKDLILQRAPTYKIRETAIQEGMTTMFEDGMRKAESGLTTLEEILRVTRE